MTELTRPVYEWKGSPAGREPRKRKVKVGSFYLLWKSGCVRRCSKDLCCIGLDYYDPSRAPWASLTNERNVETCGYDFLRNRTKDFIKANNINFKLFFVDKILPFIDLFQVNSLFSFHHRIKTKTVWKACTQLFFEWPTFNGQGSCKTAKQLHYMKKKTGWNANVPSGWVLV